MYLLRFLPLLSALPYTASAAKCYSLDGQVLDDTHAPCNPDAEFSACCSLNGTSPDNDICLDSGLCQSTSGWFAGFIYANGCTDQTGKATACPHFCDGMPEQYSFNVLQCNPGTFCCRAGSDTKNCCGDSAALVNTSHVGTLLQSNGQPINTTFNPTGVSGGSSATPSASCPADKSGVVGGAVGGVLGAALVAAIVGLVLMGRRSANFRRDLQIKQRQLDQMGYDRQMHEQKIAQMHVAAHNAAPPYQSAQIPPSARPYEMDANRGLSELSN